LGEIDGEGDFRVQRSKELDKLVLSLRFYLYCVIIHAENIMNLILGFEKSADNLKRGLMVKRVVLTVLGFLSVFGVEASMISFSVIETGLPPEAGRNQYSVRWENTLLDVFFDAGHIVSNAPIVRLDTKPSGDIMQASAFDIEEAISGGVDFVIFAQLDFSSGAPAPGEISFFIYRITGREKIFEKRIAGKNYRSTVDEVDDLKIIAWELVPFLGS